MKIVILGGGLSGLIAAYHLSKKFEVLVLEKEGVLGGLASSFKYKGKLIPRHYHHVFNHDYLTKKYLKLFDLDAVWQKIKMKIAVNGKIHDFTNPLKLLKFDYLSLFGRFRYGLFGAYVFTLMNPDKIDDNLDAEKWLMKYAGKEVTDKLFYELYAKNKFNIPLSQISAKQFANRLKAKEARGYFGYPKKSLNKMIDGLAESIEKNKGVVIKNYKLKSIDLKNKKIDSKIKYDILINTIPFPEFLKFSKNIPEEYAKKLKNVKYCPAVTILIGTKELLGKQYWLNILKEDVQMLMQHSVLYDGYDVKISWLLRYGGSEEDLVLSDSEIKTKYFNALKKYFPNINIIFSKVFKEKYASPIYGKDYFKNMLGYETEIKGLYNAGIGITYPKIRNMNTAIESGEKVARIIFKKHLS